jgi:hypothetical protein
MNPFNIITQITCYVEMPNLASVYSKTVLIIVVNAMDNILVSALARFNNLSIYNLFPDFLKILLTCSFQFILVWIVG